MPTPTTRTTMTRNVLVGMLHSLVHQIVVAVSATTGLQIRILLQTIGDDGAIRTSKADTSTMSTPKSPKTGAQALSHAMHLFMTWRSELSDPSGQEAQRTMDAQRLESWQETRARRAAKEDDERDITRRAMAEETAVNKTDTEVAKDEVPVPTDNERILQEIEKEFTPPAKKASPRATPKAKKTK